jgi:hypothetical protein
MNILLIPGTTLIAKEIRESLVGFKNLKIYGAGFDLDHPDTQDFEKFFSLDAGFSAENLDKIQNLVNKYCIKYIFLAHDQYIYDFREFTKIGDAVLIPNNKKAIEIVSFKSKTYQFLDEFLATPMVVSEFNKEKKEDLYFVKPDRGQGSKGAQKMNFEELQNHQKDKEKQSQGLIITEFLPGREFTVDCFSSNQSEVKYCSPRLRVETQNGIAVSTEFFDLPDAYEFASKISSMLQVKGAWFFQLKEDQTGQLILIEVGLRVAGASRINRLRGVNLTQMHLFQEMGFEISIPIHHTYPKLKRNKIELGFQYESVYIDFDDTLTIKGKVAGSLIKFIDDCSKSDKSVSVISRHKGNLEDSILSLFPNYQFHDIIHVTTSNCKSEYMPKNKPVLFIDDSHEERESVKRALGDSVLALDPSVFNILTLI